MLGFNPKRVFPCWGPEFCIQYGPVESQVSRESSGLFFESTYREENNYCKGLGLRAEGLRFWLRVRV